MTQYEYLEDLASQHGIVIDYSLIRQNDPFGGLYVDFGLNLPKIIMINRNITDNEQLAILAEELGHHFASTGDIVSQFEVTQRKQEALGRAWAYEHLVPPGEVFTACRDGEGSPWELSEKLGLPERFILEALEYYARKFGDIDLSNVRIHACRLPA
jgi:Zn-dependent peptidase ImmA (M78 family)